LLLGDSKTLLPVVLAEYPAIDIFFHDSLHTYEHMLLEYTLAWPKLNAQGLLLSDDVSWSAALPTFCKQVGKPFLHISGDFGAVRK
jgi:Methyltransferase domain